MRTESDFFSADEHPLLGVIRVGDNEVRQLAGLDGADLVRRADGLGGVEGRRADGLFLRNIPLEDVLQAGPQVGSRAGDGAVGQLGHAAAKPRVLTAQLELGSLRLTGAASY